MKTKKFNKKLLLNKKKIAKLNDLEEKDVRGGRYIVTFYRYTGCTDCRPPCITDGVNC